MDRLWKAHPANRLLPQPEETPNVSQLTRGATDAEGCLVCRFVVIQPSYCQQATTSKETENDGAYISLRQESILANEGTGPLQMDCQVFWGRRLRFPGHRPRSRSS